MRLLSHLVCQAGWIACVTPSIVQIHTDEAISQEFEADVAMADSPFSFYLPPVPCGGICSMKLTGLTNQPPWKGVAVFFR